MPWAYIGDNRTLWIPCQSGTGFPYVAPSNTIMNVTNTTGTTFSWNAPIYSTGSNQLVTSPTSGTILWVSVMGGWEEDPLQDSQINRVIEATEEERLNRWDAARVARSNAESERRRITDESMERERLREEADNRAEELLLSQLNADQRKTYQENGWFFVEGRSNRYRIRRHTVAGNIEVLGDGGSVLHRLCCHLDSRLPKGDHLLAQKLMLEGAEEDFQRLANRH